LDFETNQIEELNYYESRHAETKHSGDARRVERIQRQEMKNAKTQSSKGAKNF